MDVEVPRPGPEEALIRVRTAGICNTDIEITRGYKGFQGILGHEFVGDVAVCSDERWLGQRVCGEINVGCRACDQCRAGVATHCERREVIGILGRAGAFAEYLTLPLRNLHAVPDELTDDEAVFVEPVAAAYEVIRQVPSAADAEVIVLGDGKLGLLCAQVLVGAGARVTLLGRHAGKLQIASELGIEAGLAASFNGDRVEIVIEATGSPAGLQRAIHLVKPRGTIVLKSTTTARTQIDWTMVVINEITVVGSRCGPFDEAINGLLHGAVRVLPLITERYPLIEAVHAMKQASQPGTLKVLIDIGSR